MKRKDRPNKETEAVRRLAEAVLEWEEGESNSLSLQYLREITKGKSRKLDRAFKGLLDPKNPHPYWLGEPEN